MNNDVSSYEHISFLRGLVRFHQGQLTASQAQAIDELLYEASQWDELEQDGQADQFICRAYQLMDEAVA